MSKFRKTNQKFLSLKIFFILNILCLNICFKANANNDTQVLATTIITAEKQALSTDNLENSQEKIIASVPKTLGNVVAKAPCDTVPMS